MEGHPRHKIQNRAQSLLPGPPQELLEAPGLDGDQVVVEGDDVGSLLVDFAAELVGFDFEEDGGGEEGELAGDLGISKQKIKKLKT
jgi:hypothetical protein